MSGLSSRRRGRNRTWSVPAPFGPGSRAGAPVTGCGGCVTVAPRVPDVVAVVRELSDANVQFVLVGEPAEGEPLRLVVSRHPANLDAVGRALDRLGASVRVKSAGAAQEQAPDGPPHRVGDPLGAVAVRTSAGDVDLLFGGPRRSLYAEASAGARQRKVGGRRVPWTEDVPEMGPAGRVTSKMLGRRLLSLADGLAVLLDGQAEDSPAGPGQA